METQIVFCARQVEESKIAPKEISAIKSSARLVMMLSRVVNLGLWSVPGGKLPECPRAGLWSVPGGKLPECPRAGR